MSLEVVNDSILNSPEGEEYAGPDMTAEAGNVPRDSGIGPLPPSASTSGGEYRLPSDLLKPPSSREADEDEEDDEIVATLPIYLHHSLAPSLTQFQYPLQHRNLRVPTWAEERGKKITARVKEQSGRVDVEVPIDADPKVCSANKWGCDPARLPMPVAGGGEGRSDGGRTFSHASLLCLSEPFRPTCSQSSIFCILEDKLTPGVAR